MEKVVHMRSARPIENDLGRQLTHTHTLHTHRRIWLKTIVVSTVCIGICHFETKRLIDQIERKIEIH